MYTWGAVVSPGLAIFFEQPPHGLGRVDAGMGHVCFSGAVVGLRF